MRFVRAPSPALRNIGPSADKGETTRQGVDVAVAAVDAVDLCLKPGVGNFAAFVQIAVDAGQKGRVFLVADAAKIGDAANSPEKPDRVAIRSAGAGFGVSCLTSDSGGPKRICLGFVISVES